MAVLSTAAVAGIYHFGFGGDFAFLGCGGEDMAANASSAQPGAAAASAKPMQAMEIPDSL